MPNKSLRFVLIVGGIELSRHKSLDAAKRRARHVSPSHQVRIQNAYPKKGEGVRWALTADGWHSHE